MGKPDEALTVCLDAKELLYKDDSSLMDDLTLSTLQIVFQRLDHCKCPSYKEEFRSLVISNSFVFDVISGLGYWLLRSCLW